MAMSPGPKTSNDLRAYRRLARALRELPAPPTPPDLGERVLARVRAMEELRYAEIETVYGRLFAAYGPRGLKLIAPAEDGAAFAAECERRFGQPARLDPEPDARLLARLQRALAGDRRAAARLPVDLATVGDFQREVLEVARRIPRGEVRTYGWIARELGRPRAARGVGSALHHNPLPFLIPCHRVVGSDGLLRGYAFGLDTKRRVLEAEGLDVEGQESAARRGERFRGSATTRIFCFPSCHQARRIRPQNVVPFGSEREARAAGYRPCQRCRPAA
jgi:O-6-methylguanine DNA methyltransferase